MQLVLRRGPNSAAQEPEQGGFNAERRALAAIIMTRTKRLLKKTIIHPFLFCPPRVLRSGACFFYRLREGREVLPFAEASCPPGRNPRGPRRVPSGRPPRTAAPDPAALPGEQPPPLPGERGVRGLDG